MGMMASHYITTTTTTAGLLDGPPATRANRLLAHRRRPIDAVQAKVEAAGVADRVAHGISPPHARRLGAAVGAGEPGPPGGGGQAADVAHQRAVGAVDALVEAAGVAEELLGAEAAPEGRAGGVAVVALAVLPRLVVGADDGAVQRLVHALLQQRGVVVLIVQ